ncbi:hypothetical protein [Endozoicomonas sp. ISHI1]|uniref:hypothetical protein n=2 Tax=unclassified Endozoicomonas TaxID=2644528 RepID=UPI002147EDF1|nr:hypothetical protein [Endozoicomonas sp. ISHI1]
MKNFFSATLLLLLFSPSAICQAESLTRRFLVELQGGSSPKKSFSIKPDHHTLLNSASYLANTNDYTEAVLPYDGKPHRVDGCRDKTSFFESISWQLIYATSTLVAYELIMSTHDAALSAKSYSSIPLEAFLAVGWLLGSYWGAGSPLFNPMDQLHSYQGDPFAITTMMLPGSGQQQTPPSASSSQQASGATTTTTNCCTGSVTSPLSSGSGGNSEGPDQRQHTLGLNCYVDSCHGVCRLGSSSDDKASVEGALNSEKSTTDHAGATAGQSTSSSVVDQSDSEKSIIRGMKIELMGIVPPLLSMNERVCGLGTSGKTRGQLQFEVTADFDCTQEEKRQIQAEVEGFLRENVPERLRNEFTLRIRYIGPIEFL